MPHSKERVKKQPGDRRLAPPGRGWQVELSADLSVSGGQSQHPQSPTLQLQQKKLWIFRAVLLDSLMRLLRGQSDPSSQPQSYGHAVSSAPARCCTWLRQNQMCREATQAATSTTHTPENPAFLGSILVYLMANYTSENIFKCDLPCHTVHLETSPPSQHTHTVPLLSTYVSVSALVLSLK